MTYTDPLNNKSDKKYYIDTITYCYPSETSKFLNKNYGILDKYIGEYFNRNQIDNIIAEMIINHPYIDNSKELKINIMWEKDNVSGYYHRLTFTNDNYKKQTRNDNVTIKYESIRKNI